MEEVADILKAKFFDCDIKTGDTVLIHSDITRLYLEILREGVKIKPQDILELFLSLVGVEGTLLFPTFNFDFCKGIPFDIRNTKSQMGALTEVARLHPKAVRTGHPVYSFAVIGKRAEEFKEICNISGYGHDSPFAKLLALNGKIAVLNLSEQKSMTFYHFVEEECKVKYRFYKDFTGNYTDINGVSKVRTFQIYVRDIEKGVETHVEPMGEILWEKELYHGCRNGVGNGFRVIKAFDVYKEIKYIIESGKALGNLYLINL